MNKQKAKRKSYDLKQNLSSLKRTLYSKSISDSFQKFVMRKAFHGFSTTITTHKEKKKKKRLSLFTKNDFSTLDFLSSN